MLRVGLTGGLGSGKSTVAGMLRSLGAEVIESDELGRTLMEPGQPVYQQILRVFGPQVAGPDGTLNRGALAKLAFSQSRIHELNAIIHPAVIEAQRLWMDEVAARNPNAIAVIVSALILEVERDAQARGDRNPILADLRRRIDFLIVVTAPDELKIARYLARTGQSGPAGEADARSRLAFQMPDAEKAARADAVLANDGDLNALRAQVEKLWTVLSSRSNARNPGVL
jgi:dephospho-CoA kinase